MLELIVLGQVPGTNLVITFNWVLIIAASLFIGYEAYHFINRRKNAKTQSSKKVAA